MTHEEARNALTFFLSGLAIGIALGAVLLSKWLRRLEKWRAK